MGNGKQLQDEQQETPPFRPRTPEHARRDIETQKTKQNIETAARTLPETDPNLKFTEKLFDIESEKPYEEQVEQITFMQSKLMEVLVRFKKENPNIPIEKIPASGLDKVISTYHTKVSLPERLALEKFNELLKETGPTSQFLAKTWPDIIGQADDAAKGWTGRLKESFKKDPVKTGALLVAGATGVYLGYKAISGLIDWFKGGEEKKEKEGGTSIFKKILIGLGIVTAGSLLGKKALEKILGSANLKKIKALLKIGDLSDEAKEKLEKRIKELEEKAKKIEGAAERLDKIEMTNESKAGLISDALVEIHCIDRDKYPESIQREIQFILRIIQVQPVEKIINEYKKNEKNKKISASILGIDEKDAAPEAVFIAAEILTRSAKHYEKISGKNLTSNEKVIDFLLALNKDPSIGISHRISASLTTTLHNLKIDSVDDIKDHLDKFSDSEAIDTAIKENSKIYFKGLAEDFNIKLDDFTVAEKDNFLKNIAEIYTTDFDLTLSKKSIETRTSQMTSNPKIQKALVEFVVNMQSKANEVLNTAINRYDIKHSKEEFNYILSKSLKPEKISIREGMQLVLLSKGMHMERQGESSIDQAKDMAMIFLILKILKKEDRDKHDKYLTTLINESSKTDSYSFNLNINLRPFTKYFNKLLGFAIKKAKHKYDFLKNLTFGTELLSERKDKDEAIRNISWLDFGTEIGKEASIGGLRIGMELLDTIINTYKIDIDENTTQKEWYQIILSCGGELLFGKNEDGETTGVVRLAGKYFFIKPLETGWEALKSIFSEGLFSDVPIKNYLLGAAPYIGVGAVLGGAKGLAQGSIAKAMIGMLSGGTRNIFMPITMPVKGARTLRDVYRVGSRFARNRLLGKGNIRNLENACDMLIKYNHLSPPKSTWRRLKNIPSKKAPLELRRYLSGDYYLKARERYLNILEIEYNDFFGFDPDVGKGGIRHGLSQVEGDAPQKIIDKAAYMKDRIQKFHAEFPDLKNIDRTAFIERLKKFADLKDADGNKLLQQHELDGLLKRVKDDKAFKKFQKSMTKKFKFGKGKITASPEVPKKTPTPEPPEKSPVPKQRPAINTADEVIGQQQKITNKLKEIQDKIKNTANEAEIRQLRKQEAGLKKVSEALNDMKKKISLKMASAGELKHFEKKVHTALDALDDIEKEIADWTADFDKFKGAKFGNSDIIELAKLKDEKKILEFLAKKGLTDDAAKIIAQRLKTADNATDVINSLKAGGLKNIRIAPETGKFLKILKYGGELVGAGAAIYSGYEMINAFNEARNTKDSDRKSILYGRSGTYAGNLAVDGTAAIAGGLTLAGKTAAAGVAGTAGAIGFALLAPTYMIEGATESMYERTKTIEEWAKLDYRQLVHDWITTTSLSAGDAYRFFTGHEEIAAEKHTTRQKIVEAILKKEENLQEGAKVNEDRLHYIKEMCNFSPPRNFNYALSLLRDSKIYAIAIAQEKLANKDFPKNPDKKQIETLLKKTKETALASINPDLKNNFKKFTDRYLIDLYCESQSYLNGNKAMTTELLKFTNSIKAYLQFQRNIDVDNEMKNFALNIFQKNLSKEQLEKMEDAVPGKIYKFLEKPNESFAEDSINHPTEAENALYSVARFFGYNGRPKEKELKEFFNKNKKGVYGIYWNGDEWLVNDNYGSDDEVGKGLTATTINNIEYEFRKDWEDIFETRSDMVAEKIGDKPLEWIADIKPIEYQWQAQEIADALIKGYNTKQYEKEDLKPVNLEMEEQTVA